MSIAVADLLSILDLEQLEVNLFRGRSPQIGWQRVFGGQVIGQALVAATRTVEGVLPHSLHAYFLLGGDPERADRLRGRPHPRRQELHHPARRRDPARPGDLLDVGVVPQRRAGPRPSDADAGRAASGRSCRAKPRSRQKILPQTARGGAALLRARAADRTAAGRFRPLRRQAAAGQPLQHLDAHHRAAAGRSGDPSLRAGLCVRHDAARHRAAAAPAQRLRPRHHGREPRPRAVVSPAVPRRRMAALRPGQPELARRPRLRPRPDLRRRRHPGRLGRPGGPDAGAASRARSRPELPSTGELLPAGKATNPLNL